MAMPPSCPPSEVPLSVDEKNSSKQNAYGSIRMLLAALLVVCAPFHAAVASGIFGTLSNFDVYNPTPEPSEGFEIELEDISASSITGIFPSHYNVRTVTEYNNGTVFGTRIRFEDYHFVDGSGVVHTAVNPNPTPQNTNGHFCVNLADCEHFGFGVTAQPTAARYYWLNRLADGTYARIHPDPLSIPTPRWNYVPPAGGVGPRIQAEIEVPEPPEMPVQKPDSIWVKTYKTELEQEVELDDLMSGPGSIVPQDVAEVETEWELLEGGKMKMKEIAVGENNKSIVRRYEFFEYTGPYDVEHEPTTPFLEDDTLDPVALGHVGNFIAANMVAANFLVPEPSTWSLLIAGMLAMSCAGFRSRKSSFRGRE